MRAMIAAAVALACAGGVATADPSRHAVPWESHGHGLIVSYTNGSTSVTGTATTTLGPTTFNGTQSTGAGVPACPATTTTTGSTTTTFPDGDELFSSFTASVCGVVSGPAATYHLHGTFHFTGGTGRFTEARGDGRVEAVAHLAPSSEGGYRGPVRTVNRGTLQLR